MLGGLVDDGTAENGKFDTSLMDREHWDGIGITVKNDEVGELPGCERSALAGLSLQPGPVDRVCGDRFGQRQCFRCIEGEVFLPLWIATARVATRDGGLEALDGTYARHGPVRPPDEERVIFQQLPRRKQFPYPRHTEQARREHSLPGILPAPERRHVRRDPKRAEAREVCCGDEVDVRDCMHRPVITVGMARSRNRIKRGADGPIALRMEMHPKTQTVEAGDDAVQALLRDEDRSSAPATRPAA